jgi:hypothetical protein
MSDLGHFDRAYWGPNGPDISRWKGAELRRGMRYIETGAPVASGTKGQVRKISAGRKARGSAADSFERLEGRQVASLPANGGSPIPA